VGGSVIAYGKLFAESMDGSAYAIDLKTGKLLWEYSAGNAGFETAYGSWPFMGGPTVADGKIYAITGEHSPSKPLWRGGAMHVVDVDTGEPLWKISGWWQAGPGAIADGYLVSFNGYDNRLYCFGKGKTATTVSAPDTVIPQDTSVLIKGTVTDQSPAQNGTPAIADESMSPWMEYLHMQKPIPGNATGVQVALTALDPNGNTQNIGSATSDISGMFSIIWEPPVPGKYTIIATYAGSESYWPSYAETAIGVTEAPQLSPTPTPPTPLLTLPMEATYPIAGVIIALTVAVALLLFRRKK
jgi:hypothetical protein